MFPGKCICIVGTSGSGKSYVAEALAKLLDLRYVNADALSWAPNWQEVPRDQRVIAFDEATQEPGWIVDTNIGRSAEDQLLLARCDTLVWLDLPRREVLWQITRRTLRRAWTKEPLWHGNIETWRNVFSRNSMIWWAIKTYASRKRAYTWLFTDPAYTNRTMIRLHNRREVDAWLALLSNTVGRPL